MYVYINIKCFYVKKTNDNSKNIWMSLFCKKGHLISTLSLWISYIAVPVISSGISYYYYLTIICLSFYIYFYFILYLLFFFFLNLELIRKKPKIFCLKKNIISEKNHKLLIHKLHMYVNKDKFHFFPSLRMFLKSNRTN